MLLLIFLPLLRGSCWCIEFDCIFIVIKLDSIVDEFVIIIIVDAAALRLQLHECLAILALEQCLLFTPSIRVVRSTTCSFVIYSFYSFGVKIGQVRSNVCVFDFVAVVVVVVYFGGGGANSCAKLGKRSIQSIHRVEFVCTGISPFFFFVITVVVIC